MTIRGLLVVLACGLGAPGGAAAARAEGWPAAPPRGVSVVDVTRSDETLTIELSPAVLAGLDDARLREVFDYFRAACFDDEQVRSIRLQCEGRLLSSYLEPTASVGIESARAEPLVEPRAADTLGLAGTNITIGPSHGRVWNTSGGYWYWQRGEMCGLGEELMEGLLSIRLMQYLEQFLSQDGATVYVCRQLDKSDCCHPAEGQLWWRMASRYWLEHLGLPSWVWNSSTSDINDDIRARPLYADYNGSDIYISHHTNAFNGAASGTVTFRDTQMEHPQHESASYNLALAVQNNVISAIHSTYDASWYDRGVSDSAGNFGEIRIPNRPACLIELAFHDNCTLDGVCLRDPFFGTLAEWGLYKGVCEYFGRTPTWDKYSCEYVSDTIPTHMQANEVRSVDVTFRNRGVVWSSARAFKLGAVGDSDPFAATRHVVSGETYAGETHTFTFDMKAPASTGLHTTDWRMVREAVTWFGPTVTRTIQVGMPGDFDGDLDSDLDDFALMQLCLTGPAHGPPADGCDVANFDRDNDVDQDDMEAFLACMSGPDVPVDPACTE